MCSPASKTCMEKYISPSMFCNHHAVPSPSSFPLISSVEMKSRRNLRKQHLQGKIILLPVYDQHHPSHSFDPLDGANPVWKNRCTAQGSSVKRSEGRLRLAGHVQFPCEFGIVVVLDSASNCVHETVGRWSYTLCKSQLNISVILLSEHIQRHVLHVWIPASSCFMEEGWSCQSPLRKRFSCSVHCSPALRKWPAFIFFISAQEYLKI